MRPEKSKLVSLCYSATLFKSNSRWTEISFQIATMCTMNKVHTVTIFRLLGESQTSSHGWWTEHGGKNVMLEANFMQLANWQECSAHTNTWWFHLYIQIVSSWHIELMGKAHKWQKMNILLLVVSCMANLHSEVMILANKLARGSLKVSSWATSSLNDKQERTLFCASCVGKKCPRTWSTQSTVRDSLLTYEILTHKRRVFPHHEDCFVPANLKYKHICHIPCVQ